MAPATESDGSSSDLNESWERPVWYQLVDVQRNKLGSVGRVKVSSDDALIVDFLDEVEKKNKRGRLNGIVVIDLAVYDSIDATSPMKARDTIGSHGKTDSTALIVVVPSPTQLSPQPPLPLTLQPRKEQLVVGGEAFSVVEGMTVNPNKLTAFWTALAKLSSGLEYGTVIELPSGIYILGDQTRGSRVFVRDCYKRLLDVCKEKIHGKYSHLVMLGNPGIGKTFFGYVLLLEFARTHKTVVYQNTEDERILFSPDVVVRGSGDDFKQLLREPDTYYIYVQDEVYQRLYDLEKTRLLNFIKAGDGVDGYEVLRGQLFEGHAHLVLAKRGVFGIRRVLPDDTPDNAVQDATQLPLSEMETVVFKSKDELPAADDNVYLRPSAKNYKSVDSMVKPDILFQVTGAHKHPCKQGGLHSVLEQLGDPTSPRLYFVLPPDRFDEFKYQKYHDSKCRLMESSTYPNVQNIQQYALKVDLTSEQ
ncbi:hypothetical protein PHYSODRAFT_340517 [Phytophthora sojae]|uniref:Crinkler (CRN) family protein n=1 Tax=Phytophthora sojae (strain P6497) TaxID=1094619 RepID=G5A9Z8_PHYSP|nr:hypothetical protein PHYSODRAFT_340517 [Phytophthora sojae]EGZ07427.1 hypothetical protein PHYSODRAFT_340517 [Phytophthora sojae]|eukprot:XP_009536993.1 hypothetical protein PHYSODRAFT_340517 [Phytophthora sojae]